MTSCVFGCRIPAEAAPVSLMTCASTTPTTPSPSGILRNARGDAPLICLALVHGLLLVLMPSLWLVAIGLWWNANTISHNFIHLPFFRSRKANALFSGYLSVLLGLPQTIWRHRHLAHHAGRPRRFRVTWPILIESVVVAALWLGLAIFDPHLLFKAYLPGFGLGLGLCHLQGHFEHHRGTVSHYGSIYNFLLFNDGYHLEHHERPASHWTTLREGRLSSTRRSRWPAVLRWMELFSLNHLERLVLRSAPLQRLMLRTHERAFRTLLKDPTRIQKVRIVGGGLFPRTALILQKLLPDASISVIESDARHIESARRFLPPTVEFIHMRYSPEDPGNALAGVDLLVLPLAFDGDRAFLYRHPPARLVAVHDWLWRSRGHSSVVVCGALLKRLNLLRQ